MKNRKIMTAVVTALCLMVGYVFGMGYYYGFTPPSSYTWVKQGTGNQKLGFGTVISADVTDSIALGSSAAACSVTANRACQVGSGENTAADTFQYRDHQLMGSDGEISVHAFGLFDLKYSRFEEDWFESGGYIAAAATTNQSGAPIYGAKFSETAGRGTWLVTVVDGDSDNGETISIMNDERNGILAMVPNNKAGDSINAEMQGESFLIRSGYFSAYNTRFLSTDTNVTARMGLHMTGTTAGIDAPGTDYIGFRLTNSGTASITNHVYFEMAKNSTQTSVYCGAIPHGSFASMGFGVANQAGTILYVTFNGAAITNFLLATATTVPDDEALSPLMANRCLGTGQGYLKIDYIGTIQQR